MLDSACRYPPDIRALSRVFDPWVWRGLCAASQYGRPVALSDEDSWTAEYDAVCISLIQGVVPNDARDVMCPEGSYEFDSRDEVEAWVLDSESYDRAWLAVGEVRGLTFLWEQSGWAGADPALARAVSERGSFQGMFWNVNSVMNFLLARQGVLLRQFDPLFHDDDPSPVSEVGDRLSEEVGLDWESAPRLSGLEVLSRLTGVDPVSPVLLEAPEVRFFGRHF